MTSPVIFNSNNDEWYTPPFILDIARLFLKEIDLDVASSEISNKNVNANRYFDINNDALSQEWIANTVWMNPPYSRNLFDKFIDKFIQEYDKKCFSRGLVLTNNNTETKSGQMLLKKCNHALFFNKRIKFLDENLKTKKTPLQGQILFFFCNESDLVLSIKNELIKHGTLLANNELNNSGE